MTNAETLLDINKKERENVEKLIAAKPYEAFSKCIAFLDDLELWISLCGLFSECPLVKEARSQFISSIVLCAQGLYRPSIFALWTAIIFVESENAPKV